MSMEFFKQKQTGPSKSAQTRTEGTKNENQVKFFAAWSSLTHKRTKTAQKNRVSTYFNHRTASFSVSLLE